MPFSPHLCTIFCKACCEVIVTVKACFYKTYHLHSSVEVKTIINVLSSYSGLWHVVHVTDLEGTSFVY